MWLQNISKLLLVFWITFCVHGDDLISLKPQKKIIANQGDEVRFVCQVTVPDHLNEEELRIRWKHNGIYIHPQKRQEKYRVDSKGQTLVIKKVQGDDAGVYACIVNIDLDRDIASGRLDVRVPPTAPQDVSIISCTGNSAELIWEPGHDGGSKILSYLVQFNTSENPLHWNYYFEEIPGDVKSIHVNLPAWGTYSFRILAKNSVGYSGPSSPTKDHCTTPPEKPGGNPKDVRTLTYKKGKLIVTWTPVPRLLHSGPGFRYVIYWRRKGSTYWNKNTVETAEVNVWEVGVNDTYSLYEIKVKSHNRIGESRQPAFIYLGHSGEAEPTVVPKDFRLDPLKPVEPHKAHFIWEAVDTAEQKIRGDFKGYKLRYWKSSEGRHKWKEVDIIITKSDSHRVDVRAEIEDLPAYTALRAQVSVMNTHYTGPPSQTIDFSTPEGVPDPVRDLHIESHGTTYVLLKWLPPEEPNGRLLGYDIGYQPGLTYNYIPPQINIQLKIKGQDKGPIKALRPQIENPDTLRARITGLSSNHNYRFYVWARTNSGRGEPIFLDVRTKNGEPPDTPQPKFTTLDQTSVNITWTPYRLVDVDYILEYRPTGDAIWSTTNSEWGRSWMVINDLLPNTEYEVKVIAKNKFGDTASSTLYRVTTQPRAGRDAHYIQSPRETVPEDTSSSNYIHQPISLNLASWRTRILIVQVILTLFLTRVVFH